jgi:HAD superfamily hydrolase (TIGR01509 family)
MTQKIQAVIFDMDGLLVNSEPLINAAAIAMFKEKGLAVRPEDFLPFVGAGEDRYIGGVAEKYHFPLDVPQAKKRTYEIYLDLVPTQLEAFPGVHALVRTCRQASLRVAVASGTDRIKAMASLEKIGLPEESWDTVVSGEQVKRNKPAPEIFLFTADKLGIVPESCVVLEDSVNGVRAAKAAGMRCVAVAHTFPADHLQEADVVRNKISDVGLSDLAPGLAHEETMKEVKPNE